MKIRLPFFTAPLCIITFMFALGAWAQTSPPQHIHPNVTVIDGAKNPELIPDSTAYRLWLVTVSLPPNPTEKQQRFQLAHLSKLQLTTLDYQQLQSVLTEFKTQYQALIATYNASAKAALLRGEQADLKSFLQQRNDLVSSTRHEIALRLTQNGTARIDAHVQGAKKRIQLYTPGGPQ